MRLAEGRWPDLRVPNWSGNVMSASAVVKLSNKLSFAKLHLSHCFDVQYNQRTPKPYTVDFQHLSRRIKEEMMWSTKSQRIIHYRRFSCFQAWSFSLAR